MEQFDALPAFHVAAATVHDGVIIVTEQGHHTPGQRMESAVVLHDPGELVVVAFGDTEADAMDEALHVAETELRKKA